jgi:hypothetical protein
LIKRSAEMIETVPFPGLELDHLYPGGV